MPQSYLVEVVEKDTKIGKMYDLLFQNNDRVGVGKFKPKNAVAGQYYSYEVTMNGNFKNLAPGSLQSATAPAGGSMAATPARAASGGGGGSFDNRQEIISKQAAFNTALALVKILQDADALPIGASVKKANKADTIEAIVLDVAARFYKRATGNEMDLGEDVVADLTDAEGGANWDE